MFGEVESYLRQKFAGPLFLVPQETTLLMIKFVKHLYHWPILLLHLQQFVFIFSSHRTEQNPFKQLFLQNVNIT